jgi:hypothetical protein
MWTGKHPSSDSVASDLHQQSSGEPAWMRDIIAQYDTTARNSGSRVRLLGYLLSGICLTLLDYHDHRLGCRPR